MEFLGKLGIDIRLLIAQMINFGLLLWILKKFLYNPIVEKIEKDERELEKSKLQMEKLEKAKEFFANKKRQEEIDLKKQALKIINEAEDIADKIKEKAQEETAKEKQVIIKQIKSHLSDIENEK